MNETTNKTKIADRKTQEQLYTRMRAYTSEGDEPQWIRKTREREREKKHTYREISRIGCGHRCRWCKLMRSARWMNSMHLNELDASTRRFRREGRWRLPGRTRRRRRLIGREKRRGLGTDEGRRSFCVEMCRIGIVGLRTRRNIDIHQIVRGWRGRSWRCGDKDQLRNGCDRMGRG